MSRPKYEKLRSGLFGLVAPKALGKAHDRNLIKRRLRHIVTLVPEILNAHDVVLIASSNSLVATFDDLKAEVLKASERLSAAPRHKNIR
jgi:ribonuclease P protein component